MSSVGLAGCSRGVGEVQCLGMLTVNEGRVQESSWGGLDQCSSRGQRSKWHGLVDKSELVD